MSDTFDNPRDRRKAAQEHLSATVYMTGIVQQVTTSALYMSAGRSGMTTSEKIASISALREAAKVARQHAEQAVESLKEAEAELDKAVEMYSQQATNESSLDSIDTPADFLKLTGGEPEA